MPQRAESSLACPPPPLPAATAPAATSAAACSAPAGPSAQQRLRAIANAYQQSQALHTAALLGVADALAEGPLPLAELAARGGADADRLRRVLRLLVINGVFLEPSPGTSAGRAHMH